MSQTYVTVLRPYHARIRTRVYGLLSNVGLEIRPQDVIPAGVSDSEIVIQLRARTPEVILLPFHAHRGKDGILLNGLDLGEHLLARLTSLSRVPILMPASEMGLAAAQLRLLPKSPGSVSAELRRQVLLLNERELGEVGTASRVIQHLNCFPNSRP